MTVDINQVEAEINRGELSFQQIADTFGLKLGDIDSIFMEMMDQEAINAACDEFELYHSQPCEYDPA